VDASAVAIAAADRIIRPGTNDAKRFIGEHRDCPDPAIRHTVDRLLAG
jgi:hypothetical protein